MSRIATPVVVFLFVAPGVLAIMTSGDDFRQIHAAIRIRRDPRVVWPWLYQPDKVKAWVSWLVDVPGDQDALPSRGVRNTWILSDQHNGGTRMEIHTVVEKGDPDLRLMLTLGTPGAFQGISDHRLVNRGDGCTQLTAYCRLESENWFAKWIVPLTCRRAQQEMNTDFEQLRRLVEAQ